MRIPFKCHYQHSFTSIFMVAYQSVILEQKSQSHPDFLFFTLTHVSRKGVIGRMLNNPLNGWDENQAEEFDSNIGYPCVHTGAG